MYVHKNKYSLQKGFGNHSECLFHNKIIFTNVAETVRLVKLNLNMVEINTSLSSSVLKYWKQNYVINITEQTRLRYNIEKSCSTSKGKTEHKFLWTEYYNAVN